MRFGKILVAPLVGAWIETNAVRTGAGAAGSHPSWVRGLKQDQEEE